MNRLILIGNGFDLAHGLKTRYQDFIGWYWEKRIRNLQFDQSNVSEDKLCRYTISADNGDFRENNETFLSIFYELGLSTETDWRKLKTKIEENTSKILREDTDFFAKITKCIETKGWVDIENEYYQSMRHIINTTHDDDKLHIQIEGLNDQLSFLQNLLSEYLIDMYAVDGDKISKLSQQLYAPIKRREISVKDREKYKDHCEHWLFEEERDRNQKLNGYGKDIYAYSSQVINDLNEFQKLTNNWDKQAFLRKLDERYYGLPERIMFLDFNYTTTSLLYLLEEGVIPLIHIHGTLEDSDSIIFGYGDEMDEKFKEILNKNDNTLLAHFKTPQYLKSDNYRKVLQFIDSGPFQIYIMGHSCGNSDRTLLNTLFEHDNCVSIKPFYHEKEDGKDNYLDIVQNISRNFNDMKKMRDRVVNKEYCEPLAQK